MSNNVPGRTKVLAEHGHIDIDGEDEKKEVRDAVVSEQKQIYDEEDELKTVERSEDDKDRRAIELVQTHVQIHGPQPHSQRQPHVVRWDKFLPLRSLKVLLVENDDSTRHVVSALLRNCSYQVMPVSNGLEAWKILIDLNNQIDLVLSEVVMPGVSGITLLSNIMSHKSCQNIPMIMMSSHDSMGIVLKCLSKGAADFLVKPIRKNELKNLWQHVWRRCHSSSGSRSGSGIRTEKSAGEKNAEGSNNETGSNGDDDDDDNDENDDESKSIDLLIRDGSDNGSGTQSSWTKRAPEPESPNPMSSWDIPPDSTCAHVIYPNRSEAFASSWLPTHMKEDGGQEIKHDDIPMGKDLEIGIPMNSDLKINIPSQTVTVETNAEKNQFSQLLSKIDGDEQIEHATDKAGDMVVNDEHCNGSMGSKIPTVPLEVSNSKYKVTENSKELPSLELSLKRMGDVASTSTHVILVHSEISAFTRYNTGSTANQGQTGNVGSCSPLDNSSEAVKQSNSRCPNQTSNSSSNNNDMASTTNRSFTKPSVATTDKMPIKSSIVCSHHSSAFQPVSNPQLVGAVNVVPSQKSEMSQQARIEHYNYYHHHQHHHVIERDSNQNNLTVKNMDVKAPQCGSSNNGKDLNEANVAYCSLNGSAGGSNHGSNLHNGCSELMNIDSDNKVAIKGGVDNGDGNGSGSGSRVGVYQNRSAQREAALNKFRLKRKERCFDKKVRYQSRKKLAEQRPRVRGQFVRQVIETERKDEDS